MAEDEKEQWIERIKKELSEYAIGDQDLDAVFDPLLRACAKISRTYDEFKQCITEGVSTLKQVVRRVRF